MRYLSSGVPQLEHLVLHCPEAVGISTQEHAVCILAPCQLAPTSTVVGMREVGVRVFLDVATIGNANISTTPKNRTIVSVTVYQAFIPLRHKFFPHVQREKKGPTTAVLDGLAVAG